MSWIGQNEPTQARRNIYFWLVQSNGTTPAQLETGNRPQWSLNGSAFTNATNILSSVSTLYGRYALSLTQSETSVPGVMMFRYSSGTCFEQGPEGGPVMITPNNPYNPQYLSQQSLLQSGSTTSGALGSGETTLDGFYAGAGILVEYANGEKQFNVISTYTGSTRIATWALPMARTPGSTTTYWLIPGVTMGVPSYVSAGQAVWEYASTKTVDALTPSAQTSLIRSLLSFAVGNSRIVQQYLWPSRNRVQADPLSSTVTVYEPDDTTSSWTASTTSATVAISGFNPNG